MQPFLFTYLYILNSKSKCEIGHKSFLKDFKRLLVNHKIDYYLHIHSQISWPFTDKLGCRWIFTKFLKGHKV